MKKIPEEGDIYRGEEFDTCLDQRVWTVKSIFTPFQAVQWSLISVTRCGELLQLSSNTYERVWHMGDEGITLLNSCQVLKSLACIVVAPQLNAQLNRFLALQALVDGLGIWSATFGLKFPILLNWVKLRPGIWDGGTISSTGWGAARAPTWGCLGFAPNRWSKQCGIDILPIFLLRLGSRHLMWIASLASRVIWEGSLSMMLKSVMEGRGWWKSLQCLSMAEVVDLECSLTLSPRALEVSPM